MGFFGFIDFGKGVSCLYWPNLKLELHELIASTRLINALPQTLDFNQIHQYTGPE